MKLSVSNIAWDAGQDEAVYALMKKYGYTGLEIAPTRIFGPGPYGDLDRAAAWKEGLLAAWGFEVPSMQSIWFGRGERLFGPDCERQALLGYTKEAIDFASVLMCGNLVFGSPKNRAVPDGAGKAVWESGIRFFRELGGYAAEHGTAIGMEANPAIYNTNYINTTAEALSLIKQVASPGFLLNLDAGAMAENKERVEALDGNAGLISHVHISEPFLKPIAMDAGRRQFHGELAAFLRESGYQGFVSIEMGKTETLSVVDEALAYVKEVFG